VKACATLSPPDETFAPGLNPGAQPVFQIGNRVVTVDDVLAAAVWRGELEPFLARHRAGVEAEHRAELLGLEPDPEAVDSWVNEFRYARDLVSAEECEQWLTARGLTADDLLGTARRQALTDATGVEVTVRVDPGSRVWFADVLLSDGFDELVRAWAWRLAWVIESGELEEGIPGGKLPTETREKIEAGFAKACVELRHDERLRRELAARRLSLLWVAGTEVVFPDESAAREALFCVGEDGMGLAAIGAEHGLPRSDREGFVGDQPGDWETWLVSAKPGDAFRPPVADAADPEGWSVFHLLRRREPTLDDPDVVERLTGEIQRRHFLELEARHVRWFPGMQPVAEVGL